MTKEEGKHSAYRSIKITKTEESTKRMPVGITMKKIIVLPKGTMGLWCMGQVSMVERHTLPQPDNHCAYACRASRDARTSKRRSDASEN